VWENLLKHYLLCLLQAVLDAHTRARGQELTESDTYVFKNEESLPTQEARDIYHGLCREFFLREEVAPIPELLSARKSPVRHNELISYLRDLHFCALDTVLTTIEDRGYLPLRQQDDPVHVAARRPIIFKKTLDALQTLEKDHPERPYIAEGVSAISNNTWMQLQIINDYNGVSRKVGTEWRTILSAFPKWYVDQLERLLYFDWYTACFVGEPTDAAMWANYGDGHRGVCLKFRTHPNALGNPAITLNGIVGQRSGTNGLSLFRGNIECQFYKVDYPERFPEIDFFRSFGRLPRPSLKHWYMDAEGKMSPCGEDTLKEDKNWSEEYWADFVAAMTTKLPDYHNEKEYRLTLHSMITDLSMESSRKLKYRFEELQGIIFGMKTSTEDKLGIVRIIESKYRNEGRSNLELYQADYSLPTGKIEITKLGLVKFLGDPSS
jgi:hypothetical protein